MSNVYNFDDYNDLGKPKLKSGDRIIKIPDGRYYVYPVNYHNTIQLHDLMKYERFQQIANRYKKNLKWQNGGVNWENINKLRTQSIQSYEYVKNATRKQINDLMSYFGGDVTKENLLNDLEWLIYITSLTFNKDHLDRCTPPPCKIVDLNMCIEPQTVEFGEWACRMPYIWAPQSGNAGVEKHIHSFLVKPSTYSGGYQAPFDKNSDQQSSLSFIDTKTKETIGVYLLGNLTHPSRTSIVQSGNLIAGYTISRAGNGMQATQILYKPAYDEIPNDLTSMNGSFEQVKPFPDPCLTWKVYFDFEENIIGEGNDTHIIYPIVYKKTRYNTMRTYDDSKYINPIVEEFVNKNPDLWPITQNGRIRSDFSLQEEDGPISQMFDIWNKTFVKIENHSRWTGHFCTKALTVIDDNVFIGIRMQPDREHVNQFAGPKFMFNRYGLLLENQTKFGITNKFCAPYGSHYNSAYSDKYFFVSSRYRHFSRNGDITNTYPLFRINKNDLNDCIDITPISDRGYSYNCVSYGDYLYTCSWRGNIHRLHKKYANDHRVNISKWEKIDIKYDVPWAFFSSMCGVDNYIFFNHRGYSRGDKHYRTSILRINLNNLNDQDYWVAPLPTIHTKGYNRNIPLEEHASYENISGIGADYQKKLWGLRRLRRINGSNVPIYNWCCNEPTSKNWKDTFERAYETPNKILSGAYAYSDFTGIYGFYNHHLLYEKNSQLRLLDTSKDCPEVAAYDLGTLSRPSRTTVDHINNCCYVISTTSPGAQLAKVILPFTNIHRLNINETSRLSPDEKTIIFGEYPDPCLSWKIYYDGNGNYLETRYNEKSPDFTEDFKEKPTIQQGDPYTNTSFHNYWAEAPKGICIDKKNNTVWNAFYKTNDIATTKLYNYDKDGVLLEGPIIPPFMIHAYGLYYYQNIIFMTNPTYLSPNHFDGQRPHNYLENGVSGLASYNTITKKWTNILPNNNLIEDRRSFIGFYNMIIHDNKIYGTIHISSSKYGGCLGIIDLNNNQGRIIRLDDGFVFNRGLCERNNAIYIAKSSYASDNKWIPDAMVYKYDINTQQVKKINLPDIDTEKHQATGVGVDVFNNIWVMGTYHGFHVIKEDDSVEYRPHKNNQGWHYTYSDFVGRELFLKEGFWH